MRNNKSLCCGSRLIGGTQCETCGADGTPGIIKPLVQVVARILEKTPSLHRDHEKLMAGVYASIPELKDKTHCANCGALMVQYEYNIDILDVALIVSMGREVRRRLGKEMDFTEANKVHVTTLEVSDAVRHRTTKCSKLGLTAKFKIDNRQIRGTWVITKRGFEALRGVDIPTGTIVWRGKIIDRSSERTTFGAICAGYILRMQGYEQKHNKAPKDDRRNEMGTYNPNEWVDFAGYHDGNLF